MRVYDYNFLETAAIPSDIVPFLIQIREYRVRQASSYHQQPDVLSELVEVTEIQGTGMFSRTGRIHTTDQRLRELKDEHVAPVNRDEEEILGYRTVLETIHESHDYIGIKSSIILYLHRDLYKFSPYNFGGTFKSIDSVIQETDAAGIKRVRLQPIPAYETAASVNALCSTYNEIVGRRKAEPLLVDMLFILDFLYIHPFNDGDGRISRLLTLLLLYRHDYVVCKYISIESFIEKTENNYYATLKRSFEHWHEDKNDIRPFMRYILGILLAAYRNFEPRISVVSDMRMTKEERTRKFVNKKVGLFTKSEIIQSHPDIAATTIGKVLDETKRGGVVKTVGGGRGTKWHKT